MGAVLPLAVERKSDTLDPDNLKRLPPKPVESALGIESTEEEIATAIEAMANAKAVGPDGHSIELLKLGLLGPSCWSSTNLLLSSGARKTLRSNGRTRSYRT